MTTVRDWIAHGTYSGYQMHRKRGEPMCDDCRTAGNEYMREYRRTNRDTKEKRLSSARWRAIQRLIAEHKDRFDALLAEERG